MRNADSASRVVFLDWLRVIACLMVILVHSVEPFYLGGEGTRIQTYSDGLWCAIVDSPVRSAVPLFVLASSYLLFPLKQRTTSFFKRRFTRVLIPLFVWSLLYAVIPLYGSEGVDAFGNLKQLLLNFLMHSGHLWFVYMLCGVYLLMPMLSPWIEKISQKEEKYFLGLWFFTTAIPFFRALAEKVIGRAEVWGEASWNEFGMFYYVSGFVGYLVLGHYFRTYVKELSWKKTLLYAIPMWVVGYAIVAGGFLMQMPSEFPVNAPIGLAVSMELTWCFCSMGVALTTIAYFLIIRKIKADGWFYHNLILPISKVSYGIYLMHIFVLVFVFAQVSSWGLNTPSVMFVSTIITFVICAILAKLISYLPKSKYLIG